MNFVTSYKKKRLAMILGTLLSVLLAVGILISVFNDSLVFFYTPSQLHTTSPEKINKLIRLGGMVEKGSVVQKIEDGIPVVRFVITDGSAVMDVYFKGLLPDLFREGQGVVAEGRLSFDQKPTLFVATNVLAKHDETYMPPEVAAGLQDAAQRALTKSLITP